MQVLKIAIILIKSFPQQAWLQKLNYQLANSSDIFDTIIARRCISPNYIFLLMEQKLEIPRFCRLRISASRRAAQRHCQNHTLSDIYDELAIILKLDSEKIRSIMNLELSLERENVIAIKENIDRLEVDTILISDMYLGESEINNLLKIAGIPTHYSLILTSSGKTTGRVWQELRQQDFVVNHFGDSQYSDVHMAQQSGMSTELTKISKPTFFERELLVHGLHSLAFALREARLRTSRCIGKSHSSNTCGEPTERQCFLAKMQAEINLPLLAKIAFYIIDSIHLSPMNNVLLFSSRGSYLLFRLCKSLVSRLGIKNITCHYWLSSRDARLTSSKHYLEYCLSKAGDITYFIDLTGSLVSFSKLESELRSATDTSNFKFLLGVYYDPKNSDYRKQTLERTGVDISKISINHMHCITMSQLSDCMILPEFLNFSPEAKVIDVLKIYDSYIPKREEYEFSDEAASMVHYSSRYCTDLLENFADCASKNMLNIATDTKSEDFNLILKRTVERNYQPLADLFNTYFLEGHMASERRHLSQKFA